MMKSQQQMSIVTHEQQVPGGPLVITVRAPPCGGSSPEQAAEIERLQRELEQRPRAEDVARLQCELDQRPRAEEVARLQRELDQRPSAAEFAGVRERLVRALAQIDAHQPKLQLAVEQARSEVGDQLSELRAAAAGAERLRRQLEEARTVIRRLEAEQARTDAQEQHQLLAATEEARRAQAKLATLKQLVRELQAFRTRAEMKEAQHQEELSRAVQQERARWAQQLETTNRRVETLSAQAARAEAELAQAVDMRTKYGKVLDEIIASRGKTANQRTGAHGEEWVRDELRALFGVHARVEVTNTQERAGDLQVRWTPPVDGAGELLITVESKNSEVDAPMRSSAANQAREQIDASRAHAGLLVVRGPLPGGARIRVDETNRLVMVGECRKDGNLAAGLFTAVLIALVHEARNLARGDQGIPASRVPAVRQLLQATGEGAAAFSTPLQKIRRAIKSVEPEAKAAQDKIARALLRLEPQERKSLLPPAFAKHFSVTRNTATIDAAMLGKSPPSKKRKLSATSSSSLQISM